ncbi:MAG: non-canonical purine NTP pyrophosphatase, partial [Patescibacteria group bacterium]
MKITLVTGNPKKAAEAALILTGVELEMRSLDVPEIQSYSLEEIVEAKARAAFALVQAPVLV